MGAAADGQFFFEKTLPPLVYLQNDQAVMGIIIHRGTSTKETGKVGQMGFPMP